MCFVHVPQKEDLTNTIKILPIQGAGEGADACLRQQLRQAAGKSRRQQVRALEASALSRQQVRAGGNR